jgi:hypothetical protein
MTVTWAPPVNDPGLAKCPRCGKRMERESAAADDVA